MERTQEKGKGILTAQKPYTHLETQQLFRTINGLAGRLGPCLFFANSAGCKFSFAGDSVISPCKRADEVIEWL